MNYQEALTYLLKYADYERLPRSGIVWDLRRVDRLLGRLQNPHLYARSVHVAGTKGKGSTAAMIASILAHAGYKTGLYTSPHLLSYTERIRINGKSIAEEDWSRLVATIQPFVEDENKKGDLGELTTFELFTAMAFLHFRQAKADYQVMEVGLGGRLDATNVLKPQVCVITSISYDHMDVLGDTLTKIAGEKCGIIKTGAPVVTAPQFPEALAVVEKTCREKGVPLVKVGEDLSWKRIAFDAEGQRFRLKGRQDEYDIWIPLLGAHQMENAANAVAAVEILRENGANISRDAVIQGLAKVNWPGRLQILGKEPWVIVDGAHNAYSIQKLGEALKDYFTYDKATLILGFGNDKDVAGMVREAAKITNSIILVASKHPKAVKGEVLAAEFTQYGVTARTAATVKEAVEMASDDASPNDLIAAAGSIFVEAEVMELMGAG
jgi:dihydrofolate synthase/folylpolyglutamate synthase